MPRKQAVVRGDSSDTVIGCRVVREHRVLQAPLSCGALRRIECEHSQHQVEQTVRPGDFRASVAAATWNGL
jgi:hypothetical protein